MYGSLEPGSKTSGARSSKQIGATGRYHSRCFIRLSWSRILGEVAGAMMLRRPSARGPTSERPANITTGSPECTMGATSSISAAVTSHPGTGSVVAPTAGPANTVQSIAVCGVVFSISAQAAPMADPESFGNGGTHTQSNNPEDLRAAFHLIFKAQPPTKHNEALPATVSTFDFSPRSRARQRNS